MSTTLPLFWHLSSSSRKERIDASVKLIGALEQFQAQFVPKNIPDPISGSELEDDEDEENIAKSDGLDAFNAQDVSYSIRRLVRGLASPRENSRLGFAVALTELLYRINTVTCSQIIALIIDGTKIQGSMTGQEERDVLFARLFGLNAVIQSGLLMRTGSLDTSASSTAEASTLESYHQTIVELLALGERKSWLRESAWWTISLAIDALNGSDVKWKENAADFTLLQLFVENQTWSPEKVALCLKLQDLYPDRDWHKFLYPTFKSADLLNTGNLQLLARVLKESSVDKDDANPKAPTRSWNPQLHFVWDIILDQLIPSHDAAKQPKGSFQEFYRLIVDESLFSSTSSAERKYWGFQVFQKALTRCTQANMPMLFTKNFMRSWINHLSDHDRYLHKVARQAAAEVQAFVQSNPHLGFALILQLTGVNGNQQFDKLTKTKTVQSILTSMNSEGIKDYISYLFTQVNANEKSDAQTIKTRRLWIVEQLGSLIRSGNIPKNDEWIQSILDWLVIHGLFVIKKKSGKSPFPALSTPPSPPFSDDLRQACRTRLLGCLGDLNAHTTVVKSGEKSMKLPAAASDGELWVSKVLATIQALERDTKHVLSMNDPDEDALALRIKALVIVAQLKTASEESAKGAQLLLLGTIIQQYCQEPEETDYNALDACVDGATRMFADEGKGWKGRKSSVGSEDAALEPIDVLVDTIIGFLEKSTAYMRTISNQVFSLLSGSVRGTTIDLIIRQLEWREPAELMGYGDEDMEDDDLEAEEELSNQPDTEESDVKSDGDDDDDDDDVDVELRNRIVEALQASGIDATSDDSDHEEEFMDDEQMMVVDEQLAQVFRSRANEKKSGRNVDAQREATHFKNRVLNLVDTFVKKQPSSPHIIRLISPLVDLIVGTSRDERQLSDKAKGILRSRIGKYKELPFDADTDQVVTVLTDIHTRAQRAHSSDLLGTLNQCSIYLSKILLHLGAENSLLQIYRPSLVDFITRKNSALNTTFFQDFIRRCPTSAWSLREDLLDLSTRAVNSYRQYQAYQLMELIVNQLPAMVAMDNNHQTEIMEFMTSLHKSLLMVTSSACEEESGLTSSQMKGLFKLGIVAIRHTQRINPTLCQQIWQPDSWRILCGRLEASRFKSSSALQKMCKQLVGLAQKTGPSKSSTRTDAWIPNPTKRKAIIVPEEDTVSHAKKPKRETKSKAS